MVFSPGAHDAAGSTNLRPKPLARRLAKFSLGCFLAATVGVAAQFVITARESSLFRPDCSGRPLFARPSRPSHAVFTARLIRVSHDAWVSGKWQGKWAIGLIQDRFWGFLWWSPLVLLTNTIYQEGETYFVDGHRADGFLTHLLPIVEAWPCGGPQPLSDAAIQLRLLREAPPENEIRLIGYVRIAPGRATGMSRPPLAGMRVSVIGSSGGKIVTTDQQGIYEVAGLPPDDYTLRLVDLPDTQCDLDREVKKEWFSHEKLLRVDFYVETRRRPGSEQPCIW